MTKKTKFLIITGSSITVVLLMIALGFYFKKSNKKIGMDEYFQMAEDYISEREFRKAYGNFVSATQFEESNGLMHWNAARIALPMNWKDEALFHAEHAWRKNFRDPNVIRMIFSLQKGFKGSQTRKALDYLEKLPASKEKEVLRGEIYAVNDKYEQAVNVWKGLLVENADPTIVNKIATAMLQNKKYKETLSFLKYMSIRNGLNEEGYSYLTSLYSESRKLPESEDVLKKAKDNGFLRPLLSYNYGKYLLLAGQLEDAEKYLNQAMTLPGIYQHDIKNTNDLIDFLKTGKDPLFKKVFEHLSKELQEQINSKHFLDQPDEYFMHLLNEELLSIMMKLSFDDLSESQDKDIYFKNRKFLVEKYPDIFVPLDQTPLYYESKIALMYLYGLKKDRDAFEAIEVDENSQTALSESIALFKEAVRFNLENKHKESSEKLLGALQLVPNHPIFLFFQTDNLVVLEEYDEALFLFNKIISQNPAYHFSAIFNTKWAKAAVAKGDRKLALVIISNLHKYKIFSQSTLALYRDLSAELDDPEHSDQAQKFLEYQSDDEDNKKWGQGVLEYYRGNYKESSDIFEGLKKKSPGVVNYQIAKMLSLLAEEKYSDVIIELNKVDNYEFKHHLLNARALRGLNRSDQAISEYERTISKKKSLPIIKELCYYLIGLNKYNKAFVLLQSSVEEHRKDAEVYALIGWILKQKGDISGAREHVVQSLAKDDYNLMAKKILADLEWENGRPDLALGQCNSLIIRYPNYHPAKYLAGLCYFRMEKYDRAKKTLLEVFPHVPNKNDINFIIMESEVQLGEYENAIKRLTQLIEKQPNYKHYRRRLVDLYLESEDPVSARKLYSEIKQGLEEVDSVVLEAAILEREGKVEEGLGLLEKYPKERIAIYSWVLMKTRHSELKDFPTQFDQSVLLREDWIGMAVANDRKKNYAMAHFFYEKALNLDKQDNGILNLYARTALKLNLMSERLFERVGQALDEEPGNIFLLDTYVEILSGKSKHQDVKNLLERKGDLVLSSARLKYFLAIAYQETFDANRAIKYYSLCAKDENQFEMPVSQSEINKKIEELKRL